EVRCQYEDILAIHRRRIGRRDVVREKNVRVSQPEEILRRLALEISYDAPGHILNVERPLPKIGIVNLAQGLGVMRGHFLKNKLDVAKVGLQFAKDLVDQ